MKNTLCEKRLPFGIEEEVAKNAVMRRIDYEMEFVRPKPLSIYFRVAAAVLVLIMGGVVGYYLLGITSLHNHHSEFMVYNLPDGSSLTLKEGATASYNSSVWFISRKVKLNSGNAFFEVKKGKTFSVETHLGNVSVLGTSFEVIVAPENLAVACKTGKVRVDVFQDRSSAILTPGKGMVTDGTNAEVFEVELHEIAPWASDMREFDNVLITDVFEMLKNQTGFDIKYPKSINSKYSGRIQLNLPIDEILEIVCVPSGLHYEINNQTKKIFITKTE